MNIPPEIKKLLAEKRKAGAKWQKSHIPSNKTTFNRLSSILKSQLKVMRTNSFNNYVSTLSQHDNSIWKPIKSSHKPTLASSPVRLETPNPERWAKSDKERAAVNLLTPTHAHILLKNHLKNSYMFRSTTIFRELQYPR